MSTTGGHPPCVPVEPPTDAELLTLTREAIRALLEQRVVSFSIAGRQATRIPLQELREMERTYAARVARQQSGGVFRKVRFTCG